MRLFVVLAITAFCLFIAPGQSFAQIGPKGGGGGGGGASAAVIDRITPEQLASVLTAAGFQSQVKATKDGKIVISKIHNTNIGVFPGDCKPQGCSNLEFYAHFTDKVDLDFINAWNTQKRFIKIYNDKDGIALSMDVYLAGGVAPANIAAYAGVFDYFMGELANFQP